MVVICMMPLRRRAMIMVVMTMIMMMVVVGRSIGFRFLPVSPNSEASAGKDPVIVFFQCDVYPLQQRAQRNDGAHSTFQIWTQIEKCGNEHIACNPANGVKVKFRRHATTGPKRGTT